MSEQTPNSSEDLSGAEPSMEDILASIRKIISDDEPVAMESPEDVPAVSLVESAAPDGLDDLMQEFHMDSNDLTSDAVIDAASVADASSPMEMDSVDLNIDDVLAGLDGDVLGFEPEEIEIVKSNVSLPEDASSEVFDVVGKPSDVDTPDIESLMPVFGAVESPKIETASETMTDIIPDVDDDILSFLDADIPLEADPIELPVENDLDDDLEMDALLDDILMTPADMAGDEASIDTDAQAEPSGMQDDADLNLVKSLMADLADDPDGLETEEDLDALLAIPEVEETPDLEALIEADSVEAEAVADEPEEDILGDILNMTLEDELQNHPDDIEVDDLVSLDDILDAEQENIAENAIAVEEVQEDDIPSLSDIAAAAEADAVAVETAIAPQAVTATAGLGAVAGLAALGATTLDARPAETETAQTNAEPTTTLPSEPTPTQETSMPVQAVKTDAILDDVTEAATAGAFAELNQVVEDKAIFNERGPRIGDLVQEALRPMLKEWLDANLKGIVERAVAKEVKRISTGK